MTEDIFHKIENSYTNTFIKGLSPIEDFSTIKKGTKIFHKHTINPLLGDDFISENPLNNTIRYYNPLDKKERDYSSTGWYLWDENLAINILENSIDKFGKTLFINAIIHEKNEIIDHFLEKELLLNKKDESDRTPFYYAAKSLNLSLCKKLYDKKAVFNTIDNWEQSPLHVSVYIPEDTSEEEITSYIQASYDTTKFLLEIGIDVNCRDDIDDTPLLNSIHQKIDNFEVTQLLIEKGANIDHQNEDGTTALIYAVRNNRIKAASLLLNKNANINLIDNQNKKAFNYITSEQMIELFEQHIDKMDMETANEFRAQSLEILLKL